MLFGASLYHKLLTIRRDRLFPSFFIKRFNHILLECLYSIYRRVNVVSPICELKPENKLIVLIRHIKAFWLENLLFRKVCGRLLFLPKFLSEKVSDEYWKSVYWKGCNSSENCSVSLVFSKREIYLGAEFVLLDKKVFNEIPIHFLIVFLVLGIYLPSSFSFFCSSF